MQLYSTIDTGAGYLTLKPANGGTPPPILPVRKWSPAAGAPRQQCVLPYRRRAAVDRWTGDSVNAPGAAVFTSAQTGNPVLDRGRQPDRYVHGISLYRTPNVPFVSGNGMNTDISVGAVGGSTGLSATYVYLTAANGNIGQTQKITPQISTPASTALSRQQGGPVARHRQQRHNLKGSNAMCSSGGGCTVTSVGPSFQFTNATALNISGTLDAGNGAAVIKTLAGNLTVTNAPSIGSINSLMAGSAASYANAIILVAGANAPANFINLSGSNVFNLNGAYSRYLIYSKDAASINMGVRRLFGQRQRRLCSLLRRQLFRRSLQRAGLPASPVNAAKQTSDLPDGADADRQRQRRSAPVRQRQSDLYLRFQWLCLGDTAATALSGSLASGATVTSGVGTYPITLGTLASNGYTISYTGANLTISQRPVTIAADPQSKFFGAADPALTYQVSVGSVATATCSVSTAIRRDCRGLSDQSRRQSELQRDLHRQQLEHHGGASAPPPPAAPAVARPRWLGFLRQRRRPRFFDEVTRAVIRTNRPDATAPAVVPCRT